jgi:16S rRNA G1207 methylase RsmC
MKPRRGLNIIPAIDYTTPIQLDLRLDGKQITVITKPGLPDWQGITPATALLAEHAGVVPVEKALLLGCGHGASAAILARRLIPGELWIMDTSLIALEMTAATLKANAIQNARITWEIDLPESENGSFDAVAIELPKGRRLAQRWLAQAWVSLQAGGSLYIAGANALGVQSSLKDAEGLFGPGIILDYKKGNRVARFTRPAEMPDEPGWLREPGILPGSWHEFLVENPLIERRLVSLPGVFSYDRLDDATRLLLGQMRITLNDRVADLGCGYGILGLVAAQMKAAQVDLLDANLLALAAARENIRRLGSSNALALPSDVFSAVAGQTYTRILTNPPFHAGKGVDYHIADAFIQQSWAALEPDGELLLVANRFIRYDKMMERLFRQVSVAVEDGRYRVIAAIK